jgi:plasmid replication initiation protein
MAHSEDVLVEVYHEVENSGMRVEFDNQLNKMLRQDKHRFKNAAERWEYALYRIKGGKTLDKY